MLLIILSISLVNLISAQSIPKPSTPEFTVKYADYSHWEPENGYVYSNVPNPMVYVKNETLEIYLKNQPFSSTFENGTSIDIGYKIRWKGVGEDWTTRNFEVSKSDYTRIIFSCGVSATFYYAPDFVIYIVREHPEDFQVQAYIYKTIFQPEDNFYPYKVVILQESEWSSTRTITVPKASTPTGPTPTPYIYSDPSPDIPEFFWLIIFPLFLSTILTGLIIRRKKFSKGNLMSP
jgi:hypothetical protein